MLKNWLALGLVLCALHAPWARASDACVRVTSHGQAEEILGAWVNGRTNLGRAIDFVLKQHYPDRRDEIQAFDYLLDAMASDRTHSWTYMKYPTVDGAELYVGVGGFGLVVDPQGVVWLGGLGTFPTFDWDKVRNGEKPHTLKINYSILRRAELSAH